MNRNTIFKLLGLVLIVFVAFGTVATAQQTTYYVNVTDGDDSYTGANPTNSPAGTGPKRTLNAAITAANTLPAGTAVTMYVTAGNYNRADGGNDAGGVTLTGNRNFTFIVQTYLGFTSVDLPGGLTVNLSAGRTATWNAQSSGVEKLAITGGPFTLTQGTLDVSGLAQFSIADNTTITRAAGAVNGAVTFPGTTAYNVTYSGSTKTAGSELPANLYGGTLTINLSSNTQVLTVPSAVAFTSGKIDLQAGDAVFSAAVSFTTGGIESNAGGSGNDLTFNGAVTLSPGASASAVRIVNNGPSAMTFAGGITINARSAQGNIIENVSTGSIVVSGPLSFVNNSVSGNTGSATATILNQSTGSVNVSGVVSQTSATVSGTPYTFTVDATNNGGTPGALSLGSSSGPSTINGNLGNTSTGRININGAVTVNGTLTNTNAAGIIALGANTLTLSRTSAATHTNNGKITSAAVGSGGVTIAGAPTGAITITWAGGGDVPNITVAANSNLTVDWTADPGAKVVGNYIQSAGNSTWGGDRTVTGSLTVAAGTLTVNDAGNTSSAISGSVTLSGGTLTLGTAGLNIDGSYSQTGGTFNFGTRVVNLKGNFTRTGGTVNPGSGSAKLTFAGGGPQAFNGGANITVNHLETSGIGTAVTFASSIIVNGDATLGSGTTVTLGTFNIRMDGNGATFTLDGAYTSTAGGGVIFEGGADQYITATQNPFVPGSGIYSNIEIRMDNVTDNVIVPDGAIVLWSGSLTFTRGGLAVGASDAGGAVLNPSTYLVVPSISVNLGGAPDGKGILLDVDNNATANGTFNAAGVSYHLTYFGALTAHRTVGDEFVPGTTPYVIDLSVTTSGSFNVQLGDDEYHFTGALTVAAGATLEVIGTVAGRDLIAEGDNVTHTITGKIVTSATGIFKVTGSSVTINGSASTTASHTSSIGNAEVASSGTVTVSNLKEFSGTLTLSGGDLTLGLAKVTGFGTSGQITGAYTQSSGTTLTLASNIVTAGTATVDGTINLGAFNWLAKGNTTAAATTVFTATTGYLQFGATLTADFNAVAVPRVELLGGAGAGDVVTLASDLEVSDVFKQTRGTMDLGAFTLVISGSTWTSALDDDNNGTYEAVTFAGTGSVKITGSATVTMYEALTVPNLELDATGGTFTLATNDVATPTYRQLTVSGVFTMTDGTLALGNNDLELTGGAGALVYAAGSITAATSTSPTSTTIGELIFNSATLTTTPATGLVIPNLTLKASATVTVGGTTDFTIANRLTLDGAAVTLTTSADNRIKLADGCWVVSMSNGTGGTGDRLSHIPAFVGKVNLAYLTITQQTGKEMPTGASVLQNLYVGVGAANTLTFTAAGTTTPVVVNGTLSLVSGTLTYGATRPLQVADGATISRSGGSIDATAASVSPLGAYNLIYTGNQDVTVSSKEWPSGANITSLSVTVGPTTGTTARSVRLQADRTVAALTVNTTNAESGFLIGTDAAPRTLTVTGDMTVTRGRVSTEDLDGPVPSPDNVTGQSTLAVQGNLNASGGQLSYISINGSPPSYQGLKLTFTGGADQTITVPSAGATIGSITINKTSSSNTVTIVGGNLTCTGTVTFINGLLVTGSNTLTMSQGTTLLSSGFDRSGVVSPNVSHVVGKVAKVVPNAANVPIEFPVGTNTKYRPVTFTFSTAPAGVTITVNHVETRPTGTVGLPITDGVEPGVDIARYPGFFWDIKSNVNIPPTYPYALALTAEGFTAPTDYDNVANLRLIRRIGGPNDVNNTWTKQGVQYDNYEAAGVPTVQAINLTGAVQASSAIFTYGLKSNMVIANPFTIPTLTDAAPTFRRYLRSPALVTGNVGALSFTASIDNPAIATVTISGDTLIVTRKVSGTTTVRVTATDAADGSRITYSTSLNVVSKVETLSGAVPTEFSLEQNFPNPFNPSTMIRFALPKEAPVTLVIYNMLGVPVRTLINGEQLSAANHQVTWDGKDDAGMTVPSGMYLYRISAGSFQAARKMTLLK